MSNHPLNRAMTRCKHNAFTLPFYQVDLAMDEVLHSMLRYLNRQQAKILTEHADPSVLANAITARIPEFQRDNNKWTPGMQSAFMRNILMGLKVQPLIFYCIGDNKSNCLILDGLQRITALIRFFTDSNMSIAFTDNEGDFVITSGDILKDDTFTRHLWNLVLPLRIYQFNSEADAVRHYIEMNENITHSREDIVKAKRYWQRLIAARSQPN